jgi:hypothetical protein
MKLKQQEPACDGMMICLLLLFSFPFSDAASGVVVRSSVTF